MIVVIHIYFIDLYRKYLFLIAKFVIKVVNVNITSIVNIFYNTVKPKQLIYFYKYLWNLHARFKFRPLFGSAYGLATNFVSSSLIQILQTQKPMREGSHGNRLSHSSVIKYVVKLYKARDLVVRIKS